MRNVSNARPGIETYLRERLYAQLEAAGRRGLETEELRSPEGLEAPPEAMRQALVELEAEGRAVEWSRRWYALRFTDLVAGGIKRLEGGDALVLTGRGGEAGYFAPRKLAKGSMDGDFVLVRPHKPTKGRSRAGDRLPEASVVKVVRRRYQTVVGTVEVDGDGRRWVTPFDSKADFDLEVTGGEEVPEGVFVVVEVDPPRPGGGHPRGRIVEVLGDPEVPGVDVEVVLRHYKIPDEFPEPVVRAAAALPEDPQPADWAGREDLRSTLLVTIDGATARDFDDAVSLERVAGGLFRLGVHIADVAHYVGEGSVLDLEAYRRGTSVYYPDRAVPMLPERLSNGLCSLRPEVPRLTMSAFLDIDSRRPGPGAALRPDGDPELAPDDLRRGSPAARGAGRGGRRGVWADPPDAPADGRADGDPPRDPQPPRIDRLRPARGRRDPRHRRPDRGDQAG